MAIQTCQPPILTGRWLDKLHDSTEVLVRTVTHGQELLVLLVQTQLSHQSFT